MCPIMSVLAYATIADRLARRHSRTAGDRLERARRSGAR